MRLPSPFACVLAGLLYLPHLAVAHSWVEQLNVIAPNGTMIGSPGFPRGNSPRGNGFNEAQMVHLVNSGHADILPTDTICSQTQNQYEQNPISPRLQAAPGQAVALRYQENGHVTLPNNIIGKPQNRGTVFVYGTSGPRPDDTLMAIHRQWTADGRGGDGRGRLIATSNYDDGQCYQINGQSISQQRQQQFQHNSVYPQGQNLWCQTDLLLPSDLPAGKPLTLYWVWDWPTMPGIDPGLPQGKQEIYTTCADVDIVPRAGNAQGVLNAQAYNWVPQDIGNAAVPAQMKQFGVANAVSNPAMIPFKGQPVSVGSNGGSSKPCPSSPPTDVPSNMQGTIAPPSASSTLANISVIVSNPGNNPPTPPQVQAPGADNGSRPPSIVSPGVFAGGSEFGTGSGTAINPVGEGNDGQVQHRPPPPSTPPAAPVPTLGPVGRLGRVVTVETFVTETVYKTVTAGAPPQGQKRNESESSISPTIVSLLVVTPPILSSPTISTTSEASLPIPTGGATAQAENTTRTSTEDSYTKVADATTTPDPSSTSTPSTPASSHTEGGVKVVPISPPVNSPHPMTSTATTQVTHMKREAQNAATSSATFHLLGISASSNPKDTPTPTHPPSSTFVTVTSEQPRSSNATERPELKTDITRCAGRPTQTVTPQPQTSTDSHSRPCIRRHGVVRLRARSPLYILPDGVVDGDMEDC